MADTIPKVTQTVTKTVRTTVTLTQEQYEPILRKAVGAPNAATVDIEDTYGGDIVIAWSTIETEER